MTAAGMTGWLGVPSVAHQAGQATLAKGRHTVSARELARAFQTGFGMRHISRA
ncbi:hypothetical protein ABGB14_14695 [Nonomuraea sp. B10E15]|uniref:hypothetical protein n=1 Tax=Nonomuraea sp. B10E15 TaxID=3153560 RepID=UPI00325C835A